MSTGNTPHDEQTPTNPEPAQAKRPYVKPFLRTLDMDDFGGNKTFTAPGEGVSTEGEPARHRLNMWAVRVSKPARLGLKSHPLGFRTCVPEPIRLLTCSYIPIVHQVFPVARGVAGQSTPDVRLLQRNYLLPVKFDPVCIESVKIRRILALVTYVHFSPNTW
jgi:hypothetical protein